MISSDEVYTNRLLFIFKKGRDKYHTPLTVSLGLSPPIVLWPLGAAALDGPSGAIPAFCHAIKPENPLK
jgi:hypothetical protein